jgi:hypothetical protein
MTGETVFIGWNGSRRRFRLDCCMVRGELLVAGDIGFLHSNCSFKLGVS